MKRLRVCVIVAALGSFASFVATPLVSQSSFIDIGTLGQGSSYLWAVNNQNDAVGWSEISGLDSEHAVLWRDGELIDLGVLPGTDVSRAFGINDRGQIVGTSVDFDPREAHAVLWEDGQPIDIAVGCNATAINNRGEIVGRCGGATLWRDGSQVPLVPPAGYSGGQASAINDAGVVAGSLRDASGRFAAFRWAGGTTTVLARPPGLDTTSATAINARGTIAGYAGPSSGIDMIEPVLWQDGVVTPLGGTWGSFHGIAWGINDRGEVVGTGHDASHLPGSPGGAFVWARGQFRFLPSDGGAQDINERGVVVGRYHYDPNIGFEQHGILWLKASTRLPMPLEAR